MVQDAKAVAVNPSDPHAVSRWRDSNKIVSNLSPSMKLPNNFVLP